MGNRTVLFVGKQNCVVFRAPKVSRTVHRSHGITIQRGRAPPVYLGWEASHGEKNGISSYIVTRLTIVNHIREQCESLYSDRITFADGHGLVGGDLSQGTV